jgi:hypothetical protein
MENFHAALAIVNTRYDGNIKFKTLEPKGRRISFTLTVVSSTIGTGKAKVTAAGSSKGPNGRRIAAACWHVHGDFFDALFRVCPDAVVMSLGKVITKDGGNWQDWNKGSMIYPKLASECCECHRNVRTEKILAAQGRI